MCKAAIFSQLHRRGARLDAALMIRPLISFRSYLHTDRIGRSVDPGSGCVCGALYVATFLCLFTPVFICCLCDPAIRLLYLDGIAPS